MLDTNTQDKIHDMAFVTVFRRVVFDADTRDIAFVEVSWHNDGDEVDENIDIGISSINPETGDIEKAFLTLEQTNQITKDVIPDIVNQVRMIASAIISLDVGDKGD